MATQYEVEISMSQETVTDLHNAGFALYGFKAVNSQQQGGAPLVWIRTTAYLNVTQINWQENYRAYISSTEISANTQIVVKNDVYVDFGQTAVVSDDGMMTVVSNTITINNQGTQPWTCGISHQLAGGGFTPICAFPLHNRSADVIAPIEKVLFMFATINVNTGTVIYQVDSSGLLIDLTESQTRAVTYDINTGWACGGQPWCQEIAPDADLVPILIES